MGRSADPLPAVRNVAGLFAAAAARRPDHPALLFHDRQLSWAEVDAEADRVAAGLRGLGLSRGDRLAIFLGNVPEFVVGYAATLRSGLVAVPVNTGYTDAEVRHLLTDCGASAVLGPRSAAGALAAARADLPDLRCVLVAGDVPADLAGDAGVVSLADLPAAPGQVEEVGGGEDLAVLLYTSGTSGRPKGAMLSHRALLANLEQVSRIEPPVVGPDDVVLLVVPLFHVYGLAASLGMVARHAATGLLVERFDPVDSLAAIRRHGVSTIVGAPPMFVAWSMLPDTGPAFAGVRLAISGAAPLPPAVLQRMREATGRPVFEGYGLTETAPVLTTTLLSDTPKPGSIGRAIPGVELRLLDEAGGPADEGDPGEIVVRGANLFSGYWPDGAGGPDADGWFATGDVAYADAEGDLHLVDRRRELILVSGFNVYPREVEEVLEQHPDVAEVAVIGIPHPYTGEAVKALVVRREPDRPAAGPTADELVEFASTRLARFKCPTVVEFVPSLPRSSTGKIVKAALREAGGAQGR